MPITLHIIREQNENKTHRVVAGDTMWDISKKYKVQLNQLKKANPQIKNIRLIYPGDIINIPDNSDSDSELSVSDDSQSYVDDRLGQASGGFFGGSRFRSKVNELTGHILATKVFGSFVPQKKVSDLDAQIVPLGATRFKPAMNKAISMANDLRRQLDYSDNSLTKDDRDYFGTMVSKAFSLTQEGAAPDISTSGSAIEIYLKLKPNTMIVGMPWRDRNISGDSGEISQADFENLYNNFLLVKNSYQNGELGTFDDHNFTPGGLERAERSIVAPVAPLPRQEN